MVSDMSLDTGKIALLVIILMVILVGAHQLITTAGGEQCAVVQQFLGDFVQQLGLFEC